MKRLLPPLCLVIFALLAAAMPAHAIYPFPGNAYCSVPPGAGAGIKSNLLLMLDNSASMYDLAYTDPSSYCIDDSYDDQTTYAGYFDPHTIYTSTNGGVRNGAMFVGGTFTVDGAAPLTPVSCSGTCAASTKYLYIAMTSTSSSRTVATFKASGNFLNWLSMSKLDIEKKVLTGGKYDGTNNYLIAETRGCQGGRFVKPLKDAPVTFVVAGPSPAAPYKDIDTLPSSGGGTQIDIYDKSFQKDACLNAISDWKAGTDFRDHLRSCMGDSYMKKSYGGVPITSVESMFLDLRSRCYFHRDDLMGFQHPPALSFLGDCNAYSGEIKSKIFSIPRYNLDDLCAARAYARDLLDHGTIGDTDGFFGRFSAKDAPVVPVTDSNLADRAARYCNAIPPTPQVIDPTATARRVGTGDDLPSFVLGAGIYGLGASRGHYYVRVPVSSAPKGLIQQYASEINFGAMYFNPVGATGDEVGTGKLPSGTCSAYPGAACSSDVDCVLSANLGTCDPAAKKCSDGAIACSTDEDCTIAVHFGPCQTGSDGGRIASYVNDAGKPAAQHTDDLVATINGMPASSWSPLAESFYNAIGYFAHRPTPMRLQAADFDENKPPSQYSCQRNNVLIVSDGISTADRREEIHRLITEWKGELPASTVTAASDGSPPFQGSYNLDDLAWLARHKNIADFARPIVNNSDFISTHVVYTGAPCGNAGCQGYDDTFPEKMMQLAASNGGGRYARAGNPGDLEAALRDVFQDIASGSGTDVAILSNGDGNGALFMHERYFPVKSFDDASTWSYWTGEMQSLWYYIDPFLNGSNGSGSTILEDTVSDLQLNLSQDTAVNLDPRSGSQADPDRLKSLWRAGLELWKRDLAASPRRIVTTVDERSFAEFSARNAATLAAYLNVSAGDAPGLIDYVHGVDKDGYRKRSVAVTKGGPQQVWKLGDIISSTPQLQSSAALGGYHLPAPRGYGDLSYAAFIRSGAYQGRGMAYVGANDGMLHAFNMGQLDSAASGYVKATLKGSDPGKEAWAFIPRNALPYLRYLADPSYQHMYFVDGKLALFDASIRGCTNDDYHACTKTKESWMTVLVGGMGLGGASSRSCAAGAPCVQAPALADPGVKDLPLGLSSYFAIDVTDPGNPVLLWEFENPSLGYATSGPAIVRVGDRSKNGRWFAVFGSGPTGPVDTATHQFTGDSSQSLKFFVVDLRTGALVRTIDTQTITNAFAGSMLGGAIDTDKWDPGAKGNYQDDAVYAGYSRKSSGSWTGGVVRIVTHGSVDPNDAANPWSWSAVTDGTGPVTGGVAKLQDRKNHNLWLYFGSGRYFFGQDDMDGRRALYGVKEPCYNHPPAAAGDLLDHGCTESASTASGWRVDLEGAERSTSTPAPSTAGAVFFTTFTPGADPCQAGASYLYGLSYDSGATFPAGRIHGKALVPLSSGATAESALDNGGEKSVPVPGVAGAAKIVTNSGLRPVRKIIQIQER